MKKREYDFYFGIDPGFTGYITVLGNQGQLIQYIKTPILTTVKKTTHRLGPKAGKVSTKTTKTLDEKSIKKILKGFLRPEAGGPRKKVLVLVERQHAMSFEGRASIAKTMYGFGFWCGLARGLGLHLKVHRAVEWQNHFWKTTAAERKADKHISKQRSVECVQAWAKDIDLRKSKRSKKADHNLADSICIARYAWHMYGPQSEGTKNGKE